MAASAHTKGGYGGVPQKVGQEFNQADKGGATLKQAMKDRAMRSNFGKKPNPFAKGK